MDIVITHGVQTVADHWTDVAKRLPGHVTVPNRRGRADSPPHGPDYELRTEVDDLHRTLDRTTRPVLVGHSYGGVIALLTAAERDDLTTLVLYEPVLPVDGPFVRPALDWIGAAMADGDRDRAFEILAVDIVGDRPEFVELFRTRDPEGWAQMLDLLDASYTELQALQRFTFDPAVLGRIKVPTTVILGETTDRPELVYGKAARAITAGIEQARLVMLPGQGHIAHRLDPELLAGTITKAIPGA